MRKVFGFSLVEMMISITIASIVSLAIVTTYTSQAGMMTNQARRNVVNSDGQDVYEMLSRLIRQANTNSFVIAPTTGALLVDFTVPTGFPIWPNTDGTTTTPFDQNAIRISWANSGSAANKIQIGTATAITGLGSATMNTLLGDSTGANSQVTNMSMVNNGDGTFQLTISVRSGNSGASATIQGEVVPRN